MPYAPTERNDASPLFAGIASAGRQLADGFEAMNTNRQKMEGLELSARMLASQHPDIIDPKTLEKFSKGGLGQREALVGQMTAAVANKYRTQSLGMEQQRINIAGRNAATDETLGTRRLDLAERAQGFDEQKTEADMASLAPRFLQGPDGNSYIYTPASRQLPQPTTKRTIPAPGGRTEDVVTDADGKPAYKLKWNPAKGEYDKFDVRPKGAGLDALLGAGLPQGGANTPGGTGGPATNPLTQGAGASTPAPKSQFEAGKVYRDGKGNKARYNEDGSWSPVK